MSLPPSSPRLPSPPPAAEIPKSPSGGPAVSPLTTPQEQTQLDTSSRRRIHPGTKAADMAAGPPLIPFHELDSAFQLQEHLAALHCHHTASNTQPITRQTALQLAQPPPGVDRTIWLYELCRFLISQCNSLIVGFLFDTPPCSANTCPEMRASEWQFLCAVHEQPKSCCAIDYCCHTLDWAANVVTDQKIFPSRFVVHSDSHSKNVGVKNLVNVFRRLHRIFAHAWFQHRGVFWSVEGQTGLYVLFKTVCDLYDLLPAENYKLPPEAEGLEAPPVEQRDPEKHVSAILKPTSQQRGPPPPEDDSMHPTRTNTRRHIRSSPSTGSAVTTVLEAEEDEPDGVSRKLRDLQISAPSPVEEEPEVADVPVIVEQSVMEQSPLQDKNPSDGISQESVDDNDAEGSDADQTVVEVDSESESESAAEDDNTTGPSQVVVSNDEKDELPKKEQPAVGESSQGKTDTTAETELETAPDEPTQEDDEKKTEETPQADPSAKPEDKEEDK